MRQQQVNKQSKHRLLSLSHISLVAITALIMSLSLSSCSNKDKGKEDKVDNTTELINNTDIPSNSFNKVFIVKQVIPTDSIEHNNTQEIEETTSNVDIIEQETTEAPVDEPAEVLGLMSLNSEDYIDRSQGKVVGKFKPSIYDISDYTDSEPYNEEQGFDIMNYDTDVKVLLFGFKTNTNKLGQALDNICERMLFDRKELQTNGKISRDENAEYSIITLYDDKYFIYLAVNNELGNVKYKLDRRENKE